MLAIGWRLRLSRPGYGLILQGGAIGVLYLTVFVAFRLYQLLPGGLVLALLAAMAIFSAMLAVLQDSRSLAAVGVSGGFLAPILASTGGGSHVMLFSFYALLNFGILVIAWYKAWRVLNLLGFAFTFIIGLTWGARYYRPELFASTEPFLILFFLFYVAIAVLFALRQEATIKSRVDGTLVFGAPLIAFGLQTALVRDFEYGAAFSALALSGFYLLLAKVFVCPGARQRSFALRSLYRARRGFWHARHSARSRRALDRGRVGVGGRGHRLGRRAPKKRWLRVASGYFCSWPRGRLSCSMRDSVHAPLAIFNTLYLGSVFSQRRGIVFRLVYPPPSGSS